MCCREMSVVVMSWDMYCCDLCILLRCVLVGDLYRREMCIVVRYALLWDCEMAVVCCVLLVDVYRREMSVIVWCALLWAVYCREMWVVVRYIGPPVVKCGLWGVASRQLVVVYYKYVVSLNAYSYLWKKRTASNPNFVIVELLFLFEIRLGFSNKYRKFYFPQSTLYF